MLVYQRVNPSSIVPAGQFLVWRFDADVTDVERILSGNIWRCSKLVGGVPWPWGYPQIMHVNRIFPHKNHPFWVPLFQETSIWMVGQRVSSTACFMTGFRPSAFGMSFRESGHQAATKVELPMLSRSILRNPGCNQHVVARSWVRLSQLKSLKFMKKSVKSKVFLHEIRPCGPADHRHASKKMPREGPEDSAGGWLQWLQHVVKTRINWLVVWLPWILFFQILGMSNHPNWRTPSFFRGVAKNHQPEIGCKNDSHNGWFMTLFSPQYMILQHCLRNTMCPISRGLFHLISKIKLGWMLQKDTPKQSWKRRGQFGQHVQSPQPSAPTLMPARAKGGTLSLRTIMELTLWIVNQEIPRDIRDIKTSHV